MDSRLLEVRAQIDAGQVSPNSLMLLFNTATDAGHAHDLETLEQTLELARAIAGTDPTFAADAERLVEICEEMLTAVGASSPQPTAAPKSPRCPECGNEVSASAVRCRRCGHLLL